MIKHRNLDEYIELVASELREEFLSTETVAHVLGVSVRTLRVMLKRSINFPYIRSGDKINSRIKIPRSLFINWYANVYLAPLKQYENTE